ncbi:MAG: CPBP family glutamic-type intramembrane protease [Microbacterium sp.]
MKNMWQTIRDEVSIDRTGITAPRPTTRARIAAWAAILGVFLLGWGRATYNALEILLGWSTVPTHRPVGTTNGAVLALIQEIAIVLIAAALIWAFRQYAHARPAAASWRTSIKTFPVSYIAVLLGFGTASFVSWLFQLTEHTFGVEDLSDPLLAVLTIINAGMAGPAEELALLALVVVALRAAGHGWTIVFLAAAAVRVPFHLYYGWGAFGLAVWACLIVLLYKRTGAIAAIILGHATFNLVNYIPVIGGAPKLVIVLIGLWVIHAHISRIEKVRRAEAAAQKDIADAEAYERGYPDRSK